MKTFLMMGAALSLAGLASCGEPKPAQETTATESTSVGGQSMDTATAAQSGPELDTSQPPSEQLETQADAVREQADKQAEAIEENADAAAEKADKASEMVKEKAEKEADALENQAEKAKQ